MRPASPTTERHRQEPESLNQDEGIQSHAHYFEPNSDHDLDPEPSFHPCQSRDSTPTAIATAPVLHVAATVDAPMTDAPVTVSIATAVDTLAPHTTTAHDGDISNDIKDLHRDEIPNTDSNTSVHHSTRQTVTVDEFFGIAHHHHHDTEIEDNYQDYDLEMSDSEGGVPLDEVDAATNFLVSELEPQNHDDDDPVPDLDDEDQVPIYPLEYFVPHPIIPFHVSGLSHEIMNPLQQPGTWVPIPPMMPPVQATGIPPGEFQALPPLFDPMMDDPVLLSNPNPTMLGSENLGLVDFLRSWMQTSRFQTPYQQAAQGVPHIAGVREQAAAQINEVRYQDLRGDECDMQGVDWTSMGITRNQARHRRHHTYKNYVNKEGSDRWLAHMDDAMIDNHESYFRFKKMHLRQDVHLAHFQLRSVLACPANNQAFYSASRGINRINPASRSTELALSMSEFTGLGAMISTLDAKHGLLMAGTFNGEYCLKNVDSEDKKNFSDGQITSDPNGITNHLQIHSSRRSGGPLAAISSNDNCFRTMDLTTEKMLSETRFPFAMNCTAISPDHRLRVMVGDNCNVLIVNSETGQIQQRLSGHRDFGFACDWSDDGWTVATGFQDKGVRIWDARYWCNSSGESRPICAIRSEMAGVRGLRFSPEGSGSKVLVAAEEADYINIIDAQTFDTKQTVDIFGEIGGIAFTNEGQDLNILCCDRHRGGLLQLERCGGGPEPFYNNSWSRQVQYWSGNWQHDRNDLLHMDESYQRKPTMLDSMPIF